MGKGAQGQAGCGEGAGGLRPAWVQGQGRGRGPRGGIPFPRGAAAGELEHTRVLVCASVHGAGEPRVCAHTRWCEHGRGGDRAPGGSSQHRGRFSRFWGRREAPSRLRNRVSASFDERRQVPRTRAGGEQGEDRRELGPAAPPPWHGGLSPVPWWCQGGTSATRPLPRAGNRQRRDGVIWGQCPGAPLVPTDGAMPTEAGGTVAAGTRTRSPWVWGHLGVARRGSPRAPRHVARVLGVRVQPRVSVHTAGTRVAPWVWHRYVASGSHLAISASRLALILPCLLLACN